MGKNRGRNRRLRKRKPEFAPQGAWETVEVHFSTRIVGIGIEQLVCEISGTTKQGKVISIEYARNNDRVKEFESLAPHVHDGMRLVGTAKVDPETITKEAVSIRIRSEAARIANLFRKAKTPIVYLQKIPYPGKWRRKYVRKVPFETTVEFRVQGSVTVHAKGRERGKRVSCPHEMPAPVSMKSTRYEFPFREYDNPEHDYMFREVNCIDAMSDREFDEFLERVTGRVSTR